ncbi:hypothetical protein Pint_14996 [Pistacia integerrima]|uniref:Uncharacterized protein n=1 Tax=Pistacia integerrima TaxID=434235 RepID=A0ACC0ZCS5_9ROSI|nr:hypothetical protein Pint_14996 [Pistacia integerrima]
METRYVTFLAVFLILLVNGCSAVDGKKNLGTNSGLDKSEGKGSSNEETGGSHSVTKSVEVDKVKEDKGNQVGKLKESINSKKIDNSTKDRDSGKGENMQKSNENNSTKEVGSKETENTKNSNGNTNEESRAKEGDNGKGILSDETISKDLPKEVGNIDDSKTLTKEGAEHEKCDSSNKCMDDGNNFVACLRVPGNDSPALSLLIQNKVKSPLSVTISAPEYVQLKETEVQLVGEGHRELMFTVKKRGTDNVIMFIAKNGNCSLDFGDLIAHNWEEESDNTPKSTYFSFMSRKSTLIFISLAALLVLAAGCMCASIRWKHFSSSSPKYQRLDMELTVSGARKLDSDANDGWDNSWGDDWDDEEAPKTPPIPVTPSVSSKGLASRRLNKEGWKD